MMYVVIKDSNGGKIREAGWHVNMGKPEVRPFNTLERHTFQVVEVQADGHELLYIRKNFRQLPDCPEKGVVVWRGDFAQFIYDHLPSY